MLCTTILQAQEKESNLSVQWCGYNQQSSAVIDVNIFRDWLDKNCEVKVLDVTGKPLAVKFLKIDFLQKNTPLVSIQNKGGVLNEGSKEKLLQMKNESLIYIEATTEQLQKAVLAIKISK